MPKVVHIQTSVQTILGRLDEEGNVVEKVPINFQIDVPSAEAMTSLVEQIKKAREELCQRSGS